MAKTNDTPGPNAGNAKASADDKRRTEAIDQLEARIAKAPSTYMKLHGSELVEFLGDLEKLKDKKVAELAAHFRKFPGTLAVDRELVQKIVKAARG